MTLSAPDYLRPEFVLRPNEQQLWAGRPQRGVLLQKGWAVSILLTALFAVLWDKSTLDGSPPFFFRLSGLFMKVVWLVVAVGGLFVNARRRAGTFYAVTSERIVIKGGVISKKATSRALVTIVDISLKEKADGSGTINFGPRGLAAMLAGAKWPLPTFELIPEARRVYGIILEARRVALARPASPAQSRNDKEPGD
jgi:hypothetical protein